MYLHLRCPSIYLPPWRRIRGPRQPTYWQTRVMKIVRSHDERQKAPRERERLREELRRLNKQYRYLEVEEEE